jgi:hypothetical protein
MRLPRSIRGSRFSIQGADVLTAHPFVSTPNNGPCSSCGRSRSDQIHKWEPPEPEFQYQGFTGAKLERATDIYAYYFGPLLSSISFRIGPCRHSIKCGTSGEKLLAFWRERSKPIKERRSDP